jgi:hypothetical protein
MAQVKTHPVRVLFLFQGGDSSVVWATELMLILPYT